MAAIPRRNDYRTWSKTEASSTSVLIKPSVWNPPAETAAPSVTRRKTRIAGRSVLGSLFRPLARHEFSISIVAIIALVIGTSITAQSVLSTRTRIRDTRIAVQRLENEIGFMEKELEDIKHSLEDVNAPEGEGTLPIETGDVVTVVLPPIQ